MVGGTTWHWGGLTLRYRPNDFILKSKFGVGVDWPLSYSDLEEPWYGEAESEIGVCGPRITTGARRDRRRTRCRRSRRPTSTA